MFKIISVFFIIFYVFFSGSDYTSAQESCAYPNCSSSSECDSGMFACVPAEMVGRNRGECGICENVLPIIGITPIPERRCPYPLCEPGSGGTQCDGVGEVCYAPDPGQHIRDGCHVCRNDPWLQPINPDGCCDPADPNSCLAPGYEGSCTVSSQSCSSGFECSWTPVRTDDTRRPVLPYNFCTNDPDPNCQTCVNNGDIWTAVGCIPTNPVAFVTRLARFAIGMGGGLALLIMLYGSFLLATSMGIPEQQQAGKETISAAIAGLAAIILAAAGLQFVGITILQLPGF